jgi:hypothetical protein
MKKSPCNSPGRVEKLALGILLIPAVVGFAFLGCCVWLPEAVASPVCVAWGIAIDVSLAAPLMLLASVRRDAQTTLKAA